MRESVLMEQTFFVIDGKNKIADILTQAEKQVGAPVKIEGYVRYSLGEGIERAEDNFANEVAKMSGAA